jgi:replicative superfamily II helicase
MIDFTKHLGKQEIIPKISPIEVYNTLDRRSEIGPLRPAQEQILNDWYANRRNERDLIIKLHTGEGKTLIGLLMLLSHLNEGHYPCLYICPNIYLVEQVYFEAAKFGIPVCKISGDNSFPNEYTEGKSILVTHVQKLFNGLSIFGLKNDSQKAYGIVLDDSHACIDSIKNTLSISVERKSNPTVYDAIKKLFEEDLCEQRGGSYADLDNQYADVVMQIPYWCWIDKINIVTSLLSSNKQVDNNIKFSWPLLRDILEYCNAYISSSKIEITPVHIPIDDFGTFSRANQRILMSATTQDDSFFVKGFEFCASAISNPLSNPLQKWYGEKMIIIPSLISEEIDRDLLLTDYARYTFSKFGVVAIVPSFSRSNYYKQLGGVVVDGNENNIFDTITGLKNHEIGKMVVFANRYDGIDLPDDYCRILIIDALPYFNSLSERHEKNCRRCSDSINIRIAQKIEQGLGRSVRGEKDYSAIIIIGDDLVRFIKNTETRKYFSAQTQKQIEIGMTIAKMATDEIPADETPLKIVHSTINQCLHRDEGWKNYYVREMNTISTSGNAISILGMLQKEKEAMEALVKMNYQKANDILQNIVDSTVDDNEKGWYIQLMAYVSYFGSKDTSNKIQLSAFQHNSELLKPREGVVYKRTGEFNQTRIANMYEYIRKHGDISKFIEKVYSIIDDLTFGVDSDVFETAVFDLGLMLGFECQRPDKQYRVGPDVLWCVDKGCYILFECKNEVKETRKTISKQEAGQVDQHLEWFEAEYKDASKNMILVISTKELSHDAYLKDDVRIMRKSKLNELKKNIKAFIKEFEFQELTGITDLVLSGWINLHNLDFERFTENYTEEPYNKDKKS